MNKNKLIFLMIIMNMVLMSGCRTLYSSLQAPVNDNWGRSFESARYVQVINIDAKNTQAVTSMDGRACQAVMDSYYIQFQRNKSQTPIYHINLGGIK